MLRTRTAIGAALMAATLALAGCTSGTAQFAAGNVQAAAADDPDSGSWTVLVYSIADTNLEVPLMEDLEELASVGTTEGLNIVAMVDRSTSYTTQPLLGIPDWTGAKILEIGKNTATELEDLGPVNTGDPDFLADFIRDGIAAYPAEHYSLVISDHGASWPGVGADGSSNNDTLTLQELDEALAKALDGLAIGTLDMIGFDACLMATYEVASALAPYADRLVASQELEPGHGWDYAAFDEVADDGEATVDELGSAIIDGFRAQSVANGTDAEITLSNVDLTRIGELEDAMSAFTDVLLERAEEAAPAVGKSLAQTLGFGSNPILAYDTHMKDLGILVSEVGIELLFASDAADDIVRTLGDVVLDRVEGQATQGATGLSIYFPPTSEYYDPDYGDLGTAGGWTDFLEAYYTQGEDIPGSAKPDLSEPPIITIGPNTATIQSTFDPELTDSIADAWIRYGIVDGLGEITYLGETSAEVSEGRAIGSYDLRTLRLSDGEDSITVYAAEYEDEAAGLSYLDVPLYSFDQNGNMIGEVILSGVLKTRSGEVLSMTYYVYDEESGTYGEYFPEPTSLIGPQALVVHPDGSWDWELLGNIGLYADPAGLSYSWEKLAPGTVLQLDLVISDFGGNSDWVSGTVTVG